MDDNKIAYPGPVQTPLGDKRTSNMTLREYAAVAAMQGLLAEGELRYEAIVSDAVDIADALIATLEEGK